MCNESIFILERILCMLSHFSRVGLSATPWTVARQGPLSMRFSRQEYWSGLPFSSPGDLPDPGVEPWVSLPLRAGGRQRAPRPLEEQEGMAGPILHLPSVSWGTAPWLWDRGTSVYRQTGVRKDPHRASSAGHRWVWGRTGKADGSRQQGSLFV